MTKKIIHSAKSKAWKEFSRWVRVRDCLETTGFPFVGVCVTCGKRYHIRYLQAGHCFGGRNNGRLFQEELVNGQCRMCNEFRHGCSQKYREIMEKRYGKEQVDDWEKEGRKVIKDRDMNFENIAKTYLDKTNVLIQASSKYVSFEDMLRDGD